MRSAVVLATLSGVLMIAQLIVAKATRDTLFLSTFPVTALPAAMIFTAAVTLPAVLGGSSLIARAGPYRFLLGFLLALFFGFKIAKELAGGTSEAGWVGAAFLSRAVAAAARAEMPQVLQNRLACFQVVLSIWVCLYCSQYARSSFPQIVAGRFMNNSYILG